MRVLKCPEAPVCALAWTPDGRHIIAGVRPDKVVIWDIASGEPSATIDLVPRVAYRFSLAVNADGSTLATGGEHLPLTFWDVRTAKVVSPLPFRTHATFGFAFSADGTFAVVPGREEDQMHYLRRWEFATGQEILPCLLAHAATFSKPAFRPDGKLLAVCGPNRGLQVLDLAANGSAAAFGVASAVEAAAWLPDGRTLVSVHSRSVGLWDVERKKERGRLKGHTRTITDVSVSPSSNLIATASEDTVRMWDGSTGQRLKSFNWNLGEVRSLCFAPDGMTVAAGGPRGDIVIFDVEESGS